MRVAIVMSMVAACGGIAVIDPGEDEPICYDDRSCCEAALALQDAKCPAADGLPRVCAIDTVPDECAPYLGDIYRCIVANADAIECNGTVPRLMCGTCTAELEAAGEPCGQAGGCED